MEWLFPSAQIDERKASIFEFNVDDILGNSVDLSTLRGKSAYLIVRVKYLNSVSINDKF